MVRFTKINNKEVPVSFGNATLIRFEEETGISILTLGQSPLNYKDSLKLIFEGLRDGHRKEGIKFDLTFEDMCDELDEDMDAITRIMNLFANSMPTEEKKTKTSRTKAHLTQTK
jgi:hypothetical protein